jgi:1-acyl-sn-glycerol-3-phosphate acyltransferase
MVIPASLGNIIMYPISKKASLRISNYIQKVLAPRLFAVMHMYKKFNFWGYEDNLDKLPKSFFVISNHQSLLDIPTFMNYFRDRSVRFVAKDTLSRHIPLVSEMLRVEEHCMIPRNAKPIEAMKVMEDFGNRIVEREQVGVLFPEGTRTRDGNVRKFYSAGFRKIAQTANLPVVLCALDGGYQLRDLRKIFTNMKRGCYRIKVLKIYDAPQTKEEQNLILEEGSMLIQQQLDEWRKLPSTQK